MALPIRATLDDILKICQYLTTKPTGVTVSEAKRVLEAHILDRRKLNAFKVWGVIDEIDGRLKLTDDGRLVVKDTTNGLPKTLRKVVRNIEPYYAAIERAAHLNEESLSATDVAAYWHNYFADEVSNNDEILNDQAVCFFQIIYGAGLGELVLGRKGSPTRVDLDHEAINSFIGNTEPITETKSENSIVTEPELNKQQIENAGNVGVQVARENLQSSQGVSRVFITHGRNTKIVEQLKEIVTFGKLMPIVAEEHETPSKPVPEKVMDDMRSCDAAIIHVAGEQTLIDDEGKQHHKINENVLIEIGAAMALYKHNFILLVEKGVQLPSNLQGLYECRYEGDKLDGDSTMKLLKAFNEFR